MHGPSIPIRPVQPLVFKYESQDYKNDTQPLPFVIHPFKNLSQLSFAEYVDGASVQRSCLQLFYPRFARHGPSNPILPIHPFDY